MHYQYDRNNINIVDTTETNQLIIANIANFNAKNLQLIRRLKFRFQTLNTNLNSLSKTKFVACQCLYLIMPSEQDGRM